MARIAGTSSRTPQRHQIYQSLRQEIIHSELTPGQALSEQELAERYEMSRTPVREALARLSDEGLVDVRPQRGTFVSRISVNEVIEVQFIRESIEIAGLADAVQNFTDRDRSRLDRLLSEQAEAGEAGELVHWYETDESFHRSLLEIGNHPLAWGAVLRAKAHLDRVRVLSLTTPAALGTLNTEHRDILSHVAQGDLPLATEALRGHLRIVLDDLQALREANQEYFT